MKIKKENLIIAFSCAVVGILLTLQMKTMNTTVGNPLSLKRSQELAARIQRLEKEKNELEKQNEEMEEKISSFENNKLDNNKVAKKIYDESNKYKTLAGYTDLEGEGLTIQIDEPATQNSEITLSIANDLDLLLNLISVLNSAGAEAISINNQRYTSFTEIQRAGNHIVINGVSTSAPIIVKVIGDPQTLESALSFKGGIKDEFIDYNYIVNVYSEKSVKITRYKRAFDFIYAKPVNEVK